MRGCCTNNTQPSLDGQSLSRDEAGSSELGRLESAACGPPPRRAYRPQRSCGRVAEGGGLLNRYRVVKPYRGFESLRLRHFPRCCFLPTKLTSRHYRSRSLRHDDETCHRRLPFSARHHSAPRSTECRDRRQWQRQVEPLSRPEASGRHRTGPHHPVAGDRGRPAVDVVGRPGGFFPRHESRYATGPGPGSQKSG